MKRTGCLPGGRTSSKPSPATIRVTQSRRPTLGHPGEPPSRILHGPLIILPPETLREPETSKGPVPSIRVDSGNSSALGPYCGVAPPGDVSTGRSTRPSPLSDMGPGGSRRRRVRSGARSLRLDRQRPGISCGGHSAFGSARAGAVTFSSGRTRNNRSRSGT